MGITAGITFRIYAASSVAAGIFPPASALCKMFLAAFMSASSNIPHSAQSYLLRRLCSAETTPHPEHLCDVNFGSTDSNSLPAHAALYSSCVRMIPQVCSVTLLFKPRFCETPTPGFSSVPAAERIMFLIGRSSIAISPKRRTKSVVMR